MNVTARASLSVIVIVSVNVRPVRERQRKHETQRAQNRMVWNMIPIHHTWIRTSLLMKTAINSRGLTIACFTNHPRLVCATVSSEKISWEILEIETAKLL